MLVECEPLSGFYCFRFTGSQGEKRCVYHAGQGPAVVIMHEIVGLDRDCIELANEIASVGFAVYLPMLFGHPGQEHGMLSGLRFCVRREFRLFAAGQRSPITDWLRDLCTHVHTRNGGPGIGLVGMCMTGSMVFALCACPAVLAAVISQPSIPVSTFRAPKYRKELAISPADLESAKARMLSRGIDILGFRYSADPFCPAERFEEAQRQFGDHFKATTFQTPDVKHQLSRWSHSVLTGTYRRDQPPSHPAHQARRAIIAFFQERLLRTSTESDPRR